MSKLSLSSQILQNTRQYTGKPICVTSFSGIPHAFLPCGADKIEHCSIFYPARQITRAGSACMEMIHGFKGDYLKRGTFLTAHSRNGRHISGHPTTAPYPTSQLPVTPHPKRPVIGTRKPAAHCGHCGPNKKHK